MSSNERTGWRDEELSARHRIWGYDCPATDIDFLLAEYDRGEPVAIIEYKHEKSKMQGFTDPNYRVLINLADRAKLPCFSVKYTEDFSYWCVYPLNIYAEMKIPISCLIMTEKQWVTFLYEIRGRKVPPPILRKIN